MSVRFWALLCGVAAIASCTANSSTPNGIALLDEDIVLQRQAQADTASREVTVNGDTLLVAIVDENFADVRVKLAAADVEPVEVENNLAGAGTEIAVLEVPRGAKVTVTLTGAQQSNRAGTVHLRVLQFSSNAADDKNIGALVVGYEQWSAATAARFRREDIEQIGLPTIRHAIASFQEPQGDATLAAEALRVKANMHYFTNDAGKAYEVGSQSVAAYQKLGTSNATPLARAQLLQALALCDLAADPKMYATTRLLLEGLVDDRGRLARIERAHAMRALAVLERKSGRADYADWRLDEAESMYKSLGVVPAPELSRCRAPSVAPVGRASGS